MTTTIPFTRPQEHSWLMVHRIDYGNSFRSHCVCGVWVPSDAVSIWKHVNQPDPITPDEWAELDLEEDE